MDKEIQKWIQLSEESLNERHIEGVGDVDKLLNSLRIALKGSSKISAKIQKNKYGDIEYTLTQED